MQLETFRYDSAAVWMIQLLPDRESPQTKVHRAPDNQSMTLTSTSGDGDR